MAIAARLSQKNKSTSHSISSPGVTTPNKFSPFYDEFKRKMDSNSPLLNASFTAQTYKEKFHQLLCWEEQEHAEQLSER